MQKKSAKGIVTLIGLFLLGLLLFWVFQTIKGASGDVEQITQSQPVAQPVANEGSQQIQANGYTIPNGAVVFQEVNQDGMKDALAENFISMNKGHSMFFQYFVFALLFSLIFKGAGYVFKGVKAAQEGKQKPLLEVEEKIEKLERQIDGLEDRIFKKQRGISKVGDEEKAAIQEEIHNLRKRTNRLYKDLDALEERRAELLDKFHKPTLAR